MLPASFPGSLGDTPLDEFGQHVTGFRFRLRLVLVVAARWTVAVNVVEVIADAPDCFALHRFEALFEGTEPEVGQRPAALTE